MLFNLLGYDTLLRRTGVTNGKNNGHRGKKVTVAQRHLLKLLPGGMS